MSKKDYTTMKDTELAKELATEREALRAIKTQLAGAASDVKAKHKHKTTIARILTELNNRSVQK